MDAKTHGNADQSGAPSNLVLWFACASVAVLVGARFIFSVHGRVSADALLGLAALLVRTALYVALGMFLESVLLRTREGYLTSTAWRRTVLHAFWVLIMFATVALAADVLVFTFAGYHLHTAACILFADGPTGVSSVIEATGLPLRLVVFAVTGAGLGLALAILLSKKSRDLSRRWNVVISRWFALKAAIACVAVLTCLDAGAQRIRDPYLWEQEIRSVPLAFAIVRPEAAPASFSVRLKPIGDLPAESAPRPPHARDKADIYVVVIESLRKDVLCPEIMPHFAEFARQSWTFEHAVTTGNVTHYSWYGLFCAQYPIYFDVAKHEAREQGSVPLALLRRQGYRVRLFATPDTAYQNLETIIFGVKGSLLDEKFHPPEHLPAERDQHVIDELVRDIAEKPAGGRFHLVALDSTHYDYAWGLSFAPPFRPFATETSIVKDYQKDPAARRLVENRYRNAAAWVDSLVGRFLDALKAAGRFEKSLVIITGDHGEAFWEHGVATHGSNLGGEQLEVAFAMHLPVEQPRRFEGVFSLLDVMPTILAGIGCEPEGSSHFAGVPLQKRLAGSGRSNGAITFQGWNDRAFRFALTCGDKRVLLELDQANPRRARRLAIKGVSAFDAAGPLSNNAGRELISELPLVVKHLPFLEFR